MPRAPHSVLVVLRLRNADRNVRALHRHVSIDNAESIRRSERIAALAPLDSTVTRLASAKPVRPMLSMFPCRCQLDRKQLPQLQRTSAPYPQRYPFHRKGRHTTAFVYLFRPAWAG